MYNLSPYWFMATTSIITSSFTKNNHILYSMLVTSIRPQKHLIFHREEKRSVDGVKLVGDGGLDSNDDSKIESLVAFFICSNCTSNDP